MGDTIQVIKERRSVRKYQDRRVPQEVIDRIVEAGTYAPTGMGKQSPIILQIKNDMVRDELSKQNAEIMGKPGTDPFYGAKDVLVVLANREIPTYLYDGSLVMGTLMLAAKDLGVDSCYIFRAKEEFESEYGKALLKSLGIDGDYEGIGHVILGYAEGGQPKVAPRKQNYVYVVE